MKEIAIIGPTASGKSDLALRLALEHNAYILSIDSLSIYKTINVASAKPSPEELAQVRHFGINELRPDEPFDVSIFIDCYRRAKEKAAHDGKHLIIVGGTGFYLKSLLSGLSEIPHFTDETIAQVKEQLLNPAKAYQALFQADPVYMQQIEPADSYRIEKMLLIYVQSGMTPTRWFEAHPPKPVIDALPLFEIDIERPLLRERIALRTHKMAAGGLIDEVASLEHQYGRSPNAMKAIGIIEVLEYLDGFVDYDTMIDNIATHTAQLAKRQQTFNRNQFETRRLLQADEILTEAALFLD